MKNRILTNLGLGLAFSLIPLAGGCLQQNAIPVETVAASIPSTSAENIQNSAAAKPQDDLSSQEESEGVSDALTKVVSEPKEPPPTLRPTEALAGLIQLSRSHVEEDVMLSFVNHANGTFALGAEEIIYLTDIGVPPSVISAMLQHDHMKFENAANPVQPPVETAHPPEPLLEPNNSELPSMPVEAPIPADYVSTDVPAPGPDVPEPDFYDALAPYGTWVDVAGTGRCWQPSVAVINTSWRPYCDRGHWVYTDCGWYWASDYSWGWAPFHYGRWFRHTNLGWCWAPDRVWGPSWVSWRYSNDYCGWAPLPPVAIFRPGLGFSYRGHSVGFNFNFGVASSCYTFVPTKNFCDTHLSRHTLPRNRVNGIFHTTVAANKIVGDKNRITNYGIPAERITAAAHARLRQVAVRGLGRGPDARLGGNRTDITAHISPVQRTIATQAPRTPTLSAKPRAEQTAAVSEQRRVPPVRSDLTRIAPQPARDSGFAIAAPRTVSNQPRHNERSPEVRTASREITSEQSGRNSSAGGEIFTQTPAQSSVIRNSSRIAARPGTVESMNSHSRIGVENRNVQGFVQPANTPVTRSVNPGHSRSAEGRPRYENPAFVARSEAAPPSVRQEPVRQEPIRREPIRQEAYNQWGAAPSVQAPQANAANNIGAVHRPHVQSPRFDASPSPSPQAPAREMPTVRQHFNASPSPSPAPAVSHTISPSSSHSQSFSHSQSSSHSQSPSSSDRRGR